MNDKAEVSIYEIIKRIRHTCKCDPSKPSFDGEVQPGGWIKWPVMSPFQFSFCPWCGKKLPGKLDDLNNKSKVGK